MKNLEIILCFLLIFLANISFAQKEIYFSFGEEIKNERNTSLYLILDSDTLFMEKMNINSYLINKSIDSLKIESSKEVVLLVDGCHYYYYFNLNKKILIDCSIFKIEIDKVSSKNYNYWVNYCDGSLEYSGITKRVKKKVEGPLFRKH